MLEEGNFGFTDHEIASQSLLPDHEHVIASAEINLQLERYLDQGRIPFGGIPKEMAKVFPCGAALEEVL